MFPGTSGQRLITQNLIADAARFEISDELSWNSIYELSKFIDIFCLYDRVIVLGRHKYSMFRRNSDFFDALWGIVDIREFRDSSNVLDTACAHLGAYLREEGNSPRLRDLIEAILSPDAVERYFSPTPDSVDDLELGDEWLKTLPTNANVISELEKEGDAHRGATFLIRSFLYLAYSDVNELPFTPDAVRTGMLEQVLDAERTLRSKLIEKLGEAGTKQTVGDEFKLTRRISPLAAIVFKRSWPRKQNIVPKMIDLRNELRSLRQRIRSVEEELLFVPRSTEVKLSRRWHTIFSELERTFGDGEGLLNLRGGLSFAELVGNLIDDKHKVGGWVKILGLPIEVIQRILARRPLVELYRLRFEVPASSNLKLAAHRLFGDNIKKDPVGTARA